MTVPQPSLRTHSPRSPAPEPLVRPLGEEDLGEIARVHLAAFPDSVLTMLGERVVRRYYRWQLLGPHDTLDLGAEEDGRLVAFCLGGHYRRSMGGFLRRNLHLLALAIALRPGVLRHPFFGARLAYALRTLSRPLRARRRRSRRPSGPAAPAGAARKHYGILAIATHPACRGRGVGARLMRWQEEEACRRGLERMLLKVAPTNERAVRFYERLGWRKELVGGVWKGHMAKRLTAPPERTSSPGSWT